ncbi:hypothetical protein AUJ14_00050 [Candidatus Micrarchaeota archaeon CG1_02_55_22]|nr:MAG: hypothetical protein AUJ14_00050 [Candidatus Micrarchaeota archaeon CG1_02_55_22]
MKLNGTSAPSKLKYLKYYLLGVADSEGCFCISLKKEPTTRFGFALDPMFHVTQNDAGTDVLELFKQALTCGRVMEKSGQPGTKLFMVDNRRQLVEKVIPFFDKYEPVLKAKDFALFRKIVLGLEEGKHSTLKGFEELARLSFEMNGNGKQRRYSLDQVLETIRARAGSSETIRRTPK